MTSKRNLLTLVIAACVFATALTGCAPAKSGKRNSKEPAPPPPVPPAQNVPIDPALQAEAKQELIEAAEAKDPLVRAHAIEGLRDSMGAEAAMIIIKHLSDDAAVVRFSAALAAGELRLSAAKFELLTLSDDKDESVQIGARFALHRIGDTRQSHDFERTCRDPSPRVRGDTALVLGLLGEKSASKILIPMLQDKNAAVRLQAAEALWRLGDDTAVGSLVGASISKYPDDQMISLLALAGPRDRRTLGHIEGQLTAEYPEVRLIATRAAGMLGSDAGYAIAVKLAADPEVDNKDNPKDAAARKSRQKVLAALAFGAIGRPDAQQYLTPLLKDSDPDVRVAAATALLQLKPA